MQKKTLISHSHGNAGQGGTQGIPGLKAAIAEHKQLIDLCSNQLADYRWKPDFDEKVGMLLDKARTAHSRQSSAVPGYAQVNGQWQRISHGRARKEGETAAAGSKDKEAAEKEREAISLLSQVEGILSGVSKSLEITLRRWQRGE